MQNTVTERRHTTCTHHSLFPKDALLHSLVFLLRTEERESLQSRGAEEDLGVHWSQTDEEGFKAELLSVFLMYSFYVFLYGQYWHSHTHIS